jgi:hypothetical protein
VEDVTEHLGLGVVRVKHRVGEEFGGANKRRRNGGGGGLRNVGKNPCRSRRGRSKYVDQCFKVFMDDGLVKGDTDMRTVHPSKVDEFKSSRSVDNLCIFADGRHVNSQGVKIGVIDDSEPKTLNAGVEQLGEQMDFPRDAGQTGWTMVDGIHGGHVREESLASTDVAGRLLSTDVLLSG